jgi:hypothetical protein
MDGQSIIEVWYNSTYCGKKYNLYFRTQIKLVLFCVPHFHKTLFFYGTSRSNLLTLPLARLVMGPTGQQDSLLNRYVPYHFTYVKITFNLPHFCQNYF